MDRPTERTDEDVRRERRNELARRLAEEVGSWPAYKLRMAYAQPEAVRAAEERERGEAEDRRRGGPTS